MVASIIIGIILSYISFSYTNKSQNINSQSILDSAVKIREAGIKMAQAEGKYRCCIDPPCTMCYLEANQWNNYTIGTCACDDLIALGQEPCPQCKKSFTCDSQEGFNGCEIDVN